MQAIKELKSGRGVTVSGGNGRVDGGRWKKTDRRVPRVGERE
jgi:hypothetical protein